jgi:PadR family transcriptional regulator, regulatory protein PadR
MYRDEQNKPDVLGHFEQLVLTAIVTLGGEAYGVPINDKVCELAQKRINMGSLYLTLDRMEEKKLLSSWHSDPAKEPRGRPRRFYRLEPAGLRALEQSLANAKRLSEQLDDNSGSIKPWLARQQKKLVRQNS